MSIKTHFKNKLSLLLFLEMKGDRIESIFKIKIKGQKDIYMPIVTDDIIKKVKDGKDVNSIPVAFFVEGMFYVLGADENFKYNDIYKTLIENIPSSRQYIKGRIAENVRLKNYEEAYIMLKGLFQVEKTKEIYEKLIILLKNLKEINKLYLEEELEIIKTAKEIDGYALPYLHETITRRDKSDYVGALSSLNVYIAKGGEETAEILDLKNSLKVVNDYDKAKEMVYEEPKDALAILIPLLDQLVDKAEIYYYIAIAYRILENHEKAIYYLEESLEIDNSYPEVFNELGINCASLEDFDSAIKYFRKVFEATKSIEVCTNLIMCYMNIKDYKQAKIHLEIAKKINPKDEIVNELENILKNIS